LNSKSRTVFLIIGILITMTSLVGFSVPIYNLFCKVTGYGGTTSYSSEVSLNIIDRDIKIQFNADVNDSLNWSFQSPKNIEQFKVGENIKVEYVATNNSNKENIGTATFNVLPEKIGPYFIKTQCFCFEKQILKSNETVQMPVVFYIDPAIAEDPTMKDIDTITLSYTFFKYIEDN
jgi:cytochrome c oxidase assembly protein subunit 11